MMAQLFDAVLVLTMVWLAWRSLAWVRLRAPDVALAEAAVGSALTGALILSALARMKRREADVAKPNPEEQP